MIEAINRALDAIDGIEQLLAMKRPYEQCPQSQSIIFAKITGAVAVETSNKPVRWKYSWVEVEKTGSAGYDGTWTTKSGGLSGTANLYNLIEFKNTRPGTTGNGVDVDTTGRVIGTDLSLRPIPIDTIVLVSVATCEGSPEYWTQYENGVEGACNL